MLRRFTYKVIICLGVFLSVFFIQPNITAAATLLDFYVPSNFRFNRDLYVGASTSPDVMYLQNLLNMSTSTRVASTGSGSNRMLSPYYGLKTQSAVDRFQKVFATDIQFEKMISTSTATSTTVISSSTVDQFTRAVLNKLIIIYSDDRERYIQERVTGTTTPTTAETFFTEEGTEFTPPPASTTQTPSVNTSGGGGSSSYMPHNLIYKGKQLMFKYSPQGMILRAIGGDALVNSVFSHTPAGKVGQLTGSGGGGAGGIGAALGIGAGAAALGAGAGAATKAVIQNFGGASTAMTTCTCSSNLLIYVQDVRGMNLPLIYQPGATILYKMYQPRSGVNMLGQYVSGGQCLIYSGTTCTSGGTPVGTMIQLGTSMTIAPGL